MMMKKEITLLGVAIPHIKEDYSIIQELEYDLTSNFLSVLWIKSADMDVKITYDDYNNFYKLEEVIRLNGSEMIKPFEEKPVTFWKVVQCLQKYEWKI